MTRHVSFYLTLILLAVLLVAVTMLNNRFFKGIQFDLTENRVYSLSEGSLAVMKELEEPVELYFFFSDKATKGMTSLRTYAERVERLLQTYATQSNGKVRLQVIDPEPFSESEDKAAAFGLTAAQLGSIGDAVYFGLAGTNLIDDQKTIGFFDPQQEQFLEYEISKLIYQLSAPALPKIALVTDLPVSGAPNPMTGRFDPPMTFYSQLQQFYEVTVVASAETALPEDTDLVVLAHPTAMSEELKRAVDDHVLANGSLVAYIDPLFESSAMGGTGVPSDNSLLQSWGIQIDTSKVLLDPQLGLDVRGQQGNIIRHPGIMGAQALQMDKADIVTSNFDVINMASAGSVTLENGSGLVLSSLISSSDKGEQIDTSAFSEAADPSALSRALSGQGQNYTLGARISGRMTSAYQSALSSDVNILVFADADMLADRFWVQQSNFFGQPVFTPFANNGDLFVNAIDNLSGSAALISVRSRGTYSRPFEKVSELEVKAAEKFRAQEERLQLELEQIEAQLSQLQGADVQSEIMLSAEQNEAIDEFVEKRMAIRRELREVRLQLERDIANLGNQLKVLNVLILPVILTLLVWGIARLLRNRAPRSLRNT